MKWRFYPCTLGSKPTRVRGVDVPLKGVYGLTGGCHTVSIKKVVVLQATRKTYRKLQGQSLDMVVRIAVENRKYTRSSYDRKRRTKSQREREDTVVL